MVEVGEWLAIIAGLSELGFVGLNGLVGFGGWRAGEGMEGAVISCGVFTT